MSACIANTDVVAKVLPVVKWLLLFIATSLLAVIDSYAQEGLAVNHAALSDLSRQLANLKVGYRYPENTYEVVTLSFKLTEQGTLDTLAFSTNTPTEFITRARTALNEQNGRWGNPEALKGWVNGKWLISHYYLEGYTEKPTESDKGRREAFLAAFQRENELFLCSSGLDHPYRCQTYYLIGRDFILFPPFHFSVKR